MVSFSTWGHRPVNDSKIVAMKTERTRDCDATGDAIKNFSYKAERVCKDQE